MALLLPCVFEQAEKNVYLEERVQVLQQQNEDLKERIDKNVAVSRSEKLLAHHNTSKDNLRSPVEIFSKPKQTKAQQTCSVKPRCLYDCDMIYALC